MILEIGIQKDREKIQVWNSQVPQTTWLMFVAVGVWVGVTLELGGFDKELVTVLDSSNDSASWWEGYRPPDVATLSGCDWVGSRVQTGVTILDEWQTWILEKGIMYPFWKVTTPVK